MTENNGMSDFVKRMRAIGDKLTRTVLAPLPASWRTPRGKFVRVQRGWRRMARGRWIPPRERQPRRMPVGAHIETRGRKR